MPTYRLPAALGGGEYEGVANNGHVILDLPSLGAVAFPEHVVTVVVPAEPASGSWVAIAIEGRDLPPYAFSRQDDTAPDKACNWWWHENQEWLSWKGVYSIGMPRRVGLIGPIAAFRGTHGDCTVCGKSVALRKDGLVSNHPKQRAAHCSGSNQKPVSEVTR